MDDYTYIAFDCDGTLFHTGLRAENTQVANDRAHLLILLSRLPKVRIIVWSGGGADYAQSLVKRFYLEEFVWRATSKFDSTLPKVDVAFDDVADFAMAKVNIQVDFAAPKDRA